MEERDWSFAKTKREREGERGKKENKGKGLSGSRWVSPSSVDGIRKQSEKTEKC